MKLCFSGFERPILLEQKGVVTLEIHNRVLFERVCRSLRAESGDHAVEPYVLCDEDGRVIASRGRFLFVESPLALPWGDRGLGGALYQRVADLLLEDPELSDSLELASRGIASSLSEMVLQLQSDYAFEADWDVQRYLKAFSFGVERDPDEATFDNCMKFLAMAHDLGLKKILVFVNLKLFLSETELSQLLEHSFLSDLGVVLLETAPDGNVWDHEVKYTIDQDFLEL